MDQEVRDARESFRREAGEALIANLKRLREKSGLSQEELSVKASLIRNHVGKIEKGRMFPELDTVYRLAGALEVEPGELLAGIYWRPDDTDAGGGRATVEPPRKSAAS